MQVRNAFRHTADAEFGSNTTVMDQTLERYRGLLGRSEMDPFAAQILLRTAYEQSFGLHDHTPGQPGDSPLALVSMNQKEDYWTYGTMYRDMAEFMTNRVHEKTGMDMVTFFKQPRYFTSMVWEILRLQREAEEAERKRLEREAQQAGQQGR